MSINVSIILISYNKYPQNLFTLYSLQNQTYDQSKMEVILVDDNSTDRTSSLQQYQGLFHFKYLRSRKKLDRAGAKNFGLQEAEGKIIIFLDGEIMVDPNFVVNHVRHYSTEKQIAVSGTSSHFCTFSILHPGYTQGQLRRLHSFIRQQPQLLNPLAELLGLPVSQARNLKNFLRYAKINKRLIPLISKEDIAAQRFKQLSFPERGFPQALQKFGNDLAGYHLAWTYFITRNVSVRKSDLDFTGPFNEQFKGWGYEDWELGYRLYKKGVKFIEDPDIISYHQEHPFSKQSRKKEQMHNYAKLANLHPEIEVCALNLGLLKKRSFLEVNNIIDDYYLLANEFPNQYVCSKNAFIKLTQQIALLLAAGKPVSQLLLQAGIEKDPVKQEILLMEIESLRKTGKYGHLLSAFDLLISF